MEQEKPIKNDKKSEYQDPKTGKFIEGNPGGGRPKGSISILTDLKAKLEKVKREQPEEYEKLLDDYWQDKGKRELLIKMIDGMPRQQTDLTSGGDKIIPIFGGLSGVSEHDSDQEDISTQEED